MADTRKIIKVFLASPSDLAEERRAAKAVADEINGLLANTLGYQVELVGWEDTVSVFGRPQAIINAELDRCELFVGMMWKKWGTPPGISGPYTSGFEEEYRRSVKRRAREGRPEISLLFKEIDQEFRVDPGEDLKKVLTFKQRIMEEREVLFQNFADLREFETKLRLCMSQYVTRLWEQAAAKASDETQTQPIEGKSAQPVEPTTSAAKAPLSSEGVRFVREFVSKTEGEQILPAEIARLRLLANIVSRAGNDEPSLGVHDANILFADSGRFTLGYPELNGLLTCGLQNYAHENVPLWRWYAKMEGFHQNFQSLLLLYTTGGYSTEVGAISAMTLIAEPLPTEPPLDRTHYLRIWLGANTEIEIKTAALGYLADLGLMSDLPAIREELDRSNSRTTSAAINAIIQINLRDSREKAISALYELQPTSLNRGLLEALFNKGKQLSAEILMRGINHRNSEVRRTTAQLLRDRRELPEKTAEQLTSDDDASVRLEALRALVDAGRTISDADAKNILIKPVGTGLSLWFSSQRRDIEGDANWQLFQRERLKLCQDAELEELDRGSSVYDWDPYFTLAARHVGKYVVELRNSIDDEFKSKFDKAISLMPQRLGTFANNLIPKARELEDHIRKDLTRRALDLICWRADPTDLIPNPAD